MEETVFVLATRCGDFDCRIGLLPDSSIAGNLTLFVGIPLTILHRCVEYSVKNFVHIPNTCFLCSARPFFQILIKPGN